MSECDDVLARAKAEAASNRLKQVAEMHAKLHAFADKLGVKVTDNPNGTVDLCGVTLHDSDGDKAYATVICNHFDDKYGCYPLHGVGDGDYQRQPVYSLAGLCLELELAKECREYVESPKTNGEKPVPAPVKRKWWRPW